MIGFNKSYQKRFTKKWTNRQIGAGTAKRQPRLIKLKPSKKSKKKPFKIPPQTLPKPQKIAPKPKTNHQKYKMT